MPKNGHATFCSMSQKCENLFSGNKKPQFWDIHLAHCIPPKRENLFSENKKPRFWHILWSIYPYFGAMVSF